MIQYIASRGNSSKKAQYGNYDKLWKFLIDKKMNCTELKEAVGISFNVLEKLGKNETASMNSLFKNGRNSLLTVNSS